MYTLHNNQLTVEILDPDADQERFGTRYCTGGYIYQVTDYRHGPLLTGPTYPDSFNWFDGQGIPDAFNLGPLCAAIAADPHALIIGIGLCDLAEDKVVEFCAWDVEQTAESDTTAICMTTAQTYQNFGLKLMRTVTLQQRTVRAHARLVNTGKAFIPMRWFPHPFYPQPETDELCKLNIPVSFPANDGYLLTQNDYICRNKWPDQVGYYQPLDHAAQTNLVIIQRHPILGMVSATCSYIPTFFPIWGNQHTFSWEPFFERLVAPEQSVEWWIDYDF